MRALPSLLHVLVTFAALTSTCGAGAKEDTNSVGTVNKVENEAQVISAPGAITAAVGTPVHVKDEPRPGANARLQDLPRQHPTHPSGAYERRDRSLCLRS